MRTLFALLLLTVPSVAGGDPGPFPTNYKQLILQAAPYLWVDPGSIRDAQISNVIRSPVGGGSWSVCVYANARNRAGGYAGMQEVGFIIKHGRIVNAGDWMSCGGGVRFTPFPELNGR